MLMQCTLYEHVPYLNLSELIQKQKEHVRTKQREMYVGGRRYPGIKVGGARG